MVDPADKRPPWASAASVREIAEKYGQDYDGDAFDPDWLDRLSFAEQQELLAHLEKLVGGERLVEMITEVWPDEPPPKHVMPIIDVMEQARVTPIRICISVGPGHAKTTTLLRSMIWWLRKSPKDQCAYITYSASQANSKLRIARQFAEDANIALANDSVGHIITEGGGGIMGAGARGKLTGQRIPGLLVVDDPYKDEFEARSSTVNHAVKERFKAVAFTRLQGGSIIVLHTRWAEDDLIGWLERDLKWDTININTHCDQQPDVLNRKMGEAAWPEKYPYEICTRPCGHDGHLAEIRRTVGEHLWHSMYQGRPRPIGKAVFHEPARYKLSEFSWTGKRGCIVVDPAATAKTSADWSVIMVIAMEGFGDQSRMYIVKVIRVQMEIPELVAEIVKAQKKYRLMVAVEAVGGFKSVPQSLRRVNPGLRVFEITVGSKDKFTRAIPVSGAWNSERVLVPIDDGSAETSWVDPLIEEYRIFTGNGDRHDDQVDCGAHGWNVLYRGAPKITDANYAEGGGM